MARAHDEIHGNIGVVVGMRRVRARQLLEPGGTAAATATATATATAAAATATEKKRVV